MNRAPKNVLVWDVVLRAVAFLLILALIGAFFMPPGQARFICWVAMPILLIVFFVARKKAGREPDEADAPWDV
jgi:hypothetical protein